MEISISQIGKIFIESVAGVSTTVAIPGMDLTIDMGRCTPVALRTSRVAFTHTHPDHVAGIHSYLGIRDLYGMGASSIYCPFEAIDQLRGLLNAIDGLQKRPFSWHLTRMGSDVKIQLKQGYYLQAFATAHSVPSCGYAIIHKRLKLKQEFKDLPGRIIAEKRANMELEIFEMQEDVLLAVTGDTTLDPLLDNPLIEQAKTLIVESTFLDDAKGIEKAHLGNHIHLDELLPLIDRWTNASTPKHVVLYHISQLYKPLQSVRLIEERLSRRARGLVTIIPPEPIT